MKPKLGGRRAQPSRVQQETDDLGFPSASELGGFARAFVAVTRDQDVSPPRLLSRGRWENTDDLGFPSEGDPADFACAFVAIRDSRSLARR